MYIKQLLHQALSPKKWIIHCLYIHRLIRKGTPKQTLIRKPHWTHQSQSESPFTPYSPHTHRELLPTGNRRHTCTSIFRKVHSFQTIQTDIDVTISRHLSMKNLLVIIWSQEIRSSRPTNLPINGKTAHQMSSIAGLADSADDGRGACVHWGLTFALILID